MPQPQSPSTDYNNIYNVACTSQLSGDFHGDSIQPPSLHDAYICVAVLRSCNTCVFGYCSPQSCPTLCHLMNCSLPGLSVYGILQTRSFASYRINCLPEMVKGSSNVATVWTGVVKLVNSQVTSFLYLCKAFFPLHKFLPPKPVVRPSKSFGLGNVVIPLNTHPLNLDQEAKNRLWKNKPLKSTQARYSF